MEARPGGPTPASTTCARTCRASARSSSPSSPPPIPAIPWGLSLPAARSPGASPPSCSKPSARVAVTAHSVDLYGQPGDTARAELTNLDAARHFIALAGARWTRSWWRARPTTAFPPMCCRPTCAATTDPVLPRTASRWRSTPELLAKAAAGPTHPPAFGHLFHRVRPRTVAAPRGLRAHADRPQRARAAAAEVAQQVLAARHRDARRACRLRRADVRLIDIERMKRISLRILAIDMAQRGADFIEVFRFFLDAGQTRPTVSVRRSACSRGVP